MGNADETKEEDLFFFGKDDDFIVVDAREDDEDDDDGATRAVDAFADAANMMMRCCVLLRMDDVPLSLYLDEKSLWGGKLRDIFAAWINKNNAEREMQRSSSI